MDALTLFEKLAEIHNNSTAALGDGSPLDKINVLIPTGEINELTGTQEYQDLEGFTFESDAYMTDEIYLY